MNCWARLQAGFANNTQTLQNTHYNWLSNLLIKMLRVVCMLGFLLSVMGSRGKLLLNSQEGDQHSTGSPLAQEKSRFIERQVMCTIQQYTWWSLFLWPPPCSALQARCTTSILQDATPRPPALAWSLACPLMHAWNVLFVGPCPCAYFCGASCRACAWSRFGCTASAMWRCAPWRTCPCEAGFNSACATATHVHPVPALRLALHLQSV